MIGDDHDKACGGGCGCKMDKIEKEIAKDVAQIQAEKFKNKFTGYEDIDAFLEDCLDTMRKKGHDYRQGNDDDVLHNFRTVSEAVGMSMEKVWFTYFYKHYSALSTFIKEDGQSESEPIEGRVKDLIVYLLLFSRMLNERKKAPWKDVAEIAKRAEAADRNYARLKKMKDANAVQIAGQIANENLQKLKFDSNLNEQNKDVDGNNLFKVVDTAGNPELVKVNDTVNINGNKLFVRTDRLRKLAGIEGVFYDPDVLNRGGEITKVLLERDAEERNRTSQPYRQLPQGVEWFNSLTHDAKASLIEEVMQSTKPLPPEDVFTPEDLKRIKEKLKDKEN